jgi:hypothetical protein
MILAKAIRNTFVISLQFLQNKRIIAAMMGTTNKVRDL